MDNSNIFACVTDGIKDTAVSSVKIYL